MTSSRSPPRSPMCATISRHRTAISRTKLSRPVRLALDDGILTNERSYFDYGCGLGDDLRILSAQGFRVSGWDPLHRPDKAIASARVVNLGYVINVIENAEERRDVLRRAWSLAEEVLVVSARLKMDSRALDAADTYADGVVTKRGTFQKFFEQQELRNWIDQSLGCSAVAAAPGVFYVFRDEGARAAYVASRYRRRLSAPRQSHSMELFRANEELLKPLMAFVGDHGRLPAQDELPNAAEVATVFGSIRRAFRVIALATDAAPWDDIAKARALDLQIYIALSQFDGRPAFSRLPRAMQRDVRGFFSTYKQACRAADELLFALGDQAVVETACRLSDIGKLTPSALYVHVSALDAIFPLLRLYEGCARGYVGRVDGANVIKLHRQEPKISYLSYPNFEADPHPALAFSLTVHLQTFSVKYRDFQSVRNPPILHRKDLFVRKDHASYAKFARLTRIEEHKGLLEETSTIGTRDGWAAALRARGLKLRGHRLVSANREAVP